RFRVRQYEDLIRTVTDAGGYGNLVLSDTARRLSLAARGNNRVGRVASAAGARARSSDDSDAGHLRGAATKLVPGAAATLWAARIWPASFVARRRRWTRIDSSSRLAFGPNRGCAIPRDYYHGLLGLLSHYAVTHPSEYAAVGDMLADVRIRLLDCPATSDM